MANQTMEAVQRQRSAAKQGEGGRRLMCGIAGTVGHVREGHWEQTHRLLEALFIASECRGQDATGFAALACPYKSPDTSRVILEKQPVRASRFIKSNAKWRRLRHQRCSIVVGHVRMATHGSPANNRNNHPHSSQDGRLHVVHNGVISDHRDIYFGRKNKMQSECDSESILHLVASSSNPLVGLRRALRQLEGSIATVVFDAEKELLWLARNEHKPLWLLKMRHNRRWFFASTRSILVKAFRKVMGKGVELDIELLFPVASQHVHLLSPTGELIADDAAI